MTKLSNQIVFFGSGPVAAKSLEFLSENFEIEAVITKPKLSNSRDSVPVIELSNKLGIKSYTPTNKLELDSLIRTGILGSKLGVLIDYGIIVSETVIDYFKLGIINSHFSLLPLLRGPDPISFSILSGVDISGVSLMLINIGIDEGKLLAQEKLKIGNLNNIELTKKLIDLSNKMLKNCLPKYLSGKLIPYPQSDIISPTYSRKLIKQDGVINWSKPSNQIEREIRAYISWPKSTTDIFGIPVIITSAKSSNVTIKPGSIKFDKSSLVIGCSDGSLSITRLKPAGKNDMTISSFIAGYKNRFQTIN
ncbi:MAG TPA: methionyl-tRNA formyltransferase [Candidatus Saccharimonadales bacterium]|jgi:methionyl-tRNA formyltransferase|nr:methionyl-tRNA formyltransferase [Candidatus Saccharimonadales bacterium]